MKNTKLKILQAVYCLGRGGAEKLVIDITRQLATHADVEVLLVSFDRTVDYEYSTEGINYRFCPVSVNLSIIGKSKISIENFAAIVKDFQPDIIHSHRYLAEVITREFIEKDVVYFTHCHDNITQFENFSFKSMFSKRLLTNFIEKKRLMLKYLESNNQVIAISENTKKYFEKTLPLKLRENIHLLSNAIDFTHYNSANSERSLDKIRIINVGIFLPKKNQIFLIEILKHLKNKNIDASIVFLGEGMQFEIVKERAFAYGLNSSVTFAGNVVNVVDYLKEANIYVHTAIYEPFGLVLLEAMASGLPVISLDGKGNRGLVKNDLNGYFIEEPNAELFAEKIISLMSSEKLYRKMSQNSVAFAEKFDIKNYVNQLLTLYKSQLK